jgi:hypothetical protein
MALVHNVNVAVTTGAQYVFNILDTLLDAGWTVSCSSDGTTYNASGNQISSAGSGAGGLNNNSAWFVVRDPGGRREYAFQRGTTAGLWRVAFSELARFTGGSPSATIVPTASDSQVIEGSGTEASPGFTANTIAATITGRAHCVAYSDPEGDVYRFWAANTATATGATAACLMVDACEVGSYPVDDVSPVVHNIFNGTVRAAALTANRWKFHSRFGLAGAAWRTSTHQMLIPGNGTLTFGLTGAGGVNEYTGEDDYIAGFYGFTAAASIGGYKGKSSEMIRVSSIYRLFPHTVNISDPDESRCYFDGFLLRWPSGVTPTI